MITVELEYRPIGFIPWVRRIEKRFPSRWSEMNAEQMSSVPYLQLGKLNDIKLLQIFLGLKKGIAKRIDSYQAFCISRFLKYIREPEPIGSFIIKNIAGFKAPEANLKNVTFGAFIFGDSYYSSYKKGRQKDLDKFIACYYLSGDGFNDKLIEQHARRISLESIATRLAIALNYELIREWLAVTYPYVFQKGEATKADQAKGWVAVFDRLVQNDFGNQDKYAQFPVSTVLRHLNNLLIDNYKNGS